MPLYEFLCESCGRRMEVIRRFSDPPVTACDRCGGSVEKLLSSSAVQFKGSGWYVSDYARAGGKEKEKEKEKESAKPAESGEKAAGAEAKAGAAEKPAEKGSDSGAGGAEAGATENPSSKMKKKKNGASK